MPTLTADAIQRGLRRIDGDLRTAEATLDVLQAATGGITRLVPADVWCGVVLDPSTLLDTGGQHANGFPETTMPRLFEIEHIEQDDVDSLRALVRRPDPVSLLSTSTGGDLSTSKYYRDILRPLGLRDELRVVLRQGGRTWGLLVLCRAAGSPAFTEADLVAARQVSTPATAALRRSLLLGGSDTGGVADAPGLVVLDGRYDEVTVSPTARRWLDDLPEHHPGRGPALPYVVRAVAARATADTATPARSRTRTRSGRWVALHAWRIGSAEAPMTAVAIGPAEPGDLAAIVLDAYGLSQRERQVTQQVLLGNSTARIASALAISEYTVQDHLKAVFDKTGVRSRRDLISTLFTRHYLPQLARPSTSTDGRVVDPDGDHAASA
ncbi:LuxR C-terminal-related transcriptional regulator [Phytohabitans sp. ZYX-F-186]|uniref:LuxR C-terminal-related transcriptional regulator n=1 Tax=Phytohabitans maris TaxID=3071409 RepID=A0ABU0ZVE6_9ACTN|nr:LuxR C-terminal-related transcriptional regulator [Phytohabitans sp. ZYX-F-186]MDQ7910913.1 LuxR C-terminal-related transcriptional regulator [Phytohabitans sp. ZYX-F-186]